MNSAREQRGLLRLLLAGALAALLTACGGGGTPPPPPPSPLVITTTSLPDGTTGQAYNQSLQASGGASPLTWSIATGSPPPGLALSSAGTFTGMPTSIGTFNFTVQVRDSSSPSQTAAQALSVRVERPLAFLTTSLPDGTTGLNYSSNLPITGGGPGPFTLTVAAGTLPAGLSMSTAGSITGIPTTVGTFSFMAQAQDSANPPRTARRGFLIRVSSVLAVTTTRLPAGTAQAFYSGILGATGGVPPRTWSVLPPGAAALTAAGLSLDSTTGEISGTLSSTPGTVNFTVQVMDSASPPKTAPQTLSIIIAPASGAGSLGRNDTLPNATALSNGTYRASISPMDENPPGTVRSDNDIYKLTANGGAVVTIEITARRLVPPSSLDSVIEIVDVNNVRLPTCRTPASTTGLFNESCMNDDIVMGVLQDSRLEFQVPAGPPLTLYVRVLDFRGDARPDFLYTITITGAN